MKKKAFTTLGWMVSLTLIALMLMRLDVQTMLDGFGRARWSYLVAAAAVNIIVVILKAMRWRMIMAPERHAGLGNIFKATMIGYAANNVMPARGGDVVRIFLLGRWEKTSRTTLASIAMLDKVFEGLAMLILFVALSFHSTFPDWVRSGTLIISISISILLIMSFLIMFQRRRIIADDAEPVGRFERLVFKLGSGLRALTNLKLTAKAVAISLLTCAIQVLTIWLCQMAFGIFLNPWVSALIFVAINLAIMIPSAPSGIGPFEVGAVLAYIWVGLRPEMGFNIALMYHAVQFIPVTVAGAVTYWLSIGARGGAKVSMETSE